MPANAKMRRRLRRLVRSYCVEYLSDRDRETITLATATNDLKAELSADFGDTDWIALILEILEFILPLLIDIFTEE